MKKFILVIPIFLMFISCSINPSESNYYAMEIALENAKAQLGSVNGFERYVWSREYTQQNVKIKIVREIYLSDSEFKMILIQMNNGSQLVQGEFEEFTNQIFRQDIAEGTFTKSLSSSKNIQNDRGEVITDRRGFETFFSLTPRLSKKWRYRSQIWVDAPQDTAYTEKGNRPQPTDPFYLLVDDKDANISILSVFRRESDRYTVPFLRLPQGQNFIKK